ncbi:MULTISPECIES: glycine betaine ABC transporter substrate-binding protein [Pontibacillus]|uniref:Glycine betaine ABC transporter substrate-binding protein n=1 Tax=Pontibacillus chungwhensis TaxID=265426 RepID=A0ABY8V2B1_9BACI|nr:MULTISPECIES: glycine betaine ABC transporter substrate-binding protein [Pontibacillus]MCD5324966.1 glycine/betaine ABC transporter [Pontibacillus sp. HN14]WIF98924.1 glycine betaine ABC transporter substrate-binding protein [Pontibacillus chungwhensis]
MNWKKLGLTAGLSLSLALTACGSTEDDSSNGGDSGDSKESVGEQLDYTLTGIESGAGIMVATDKALEEYDNLEGWEVSSSSSAVMTEQLGNAIENKEPIIVTGWTPHWKFAEYDLKYLEDPKEAYGSTEHINTIVRKGFEEDMPKAAKILDNFKWTPDDMQSVMLELQEGTDPVKAAKNWIENNGDKVDEWTKGIEDGSGTVKLAYVPWQSEISSTHVISEVLKQKGFETDLTQAGIGPMFQAIADGDSDAMTSAWLPRTHGDHYEKFKDEFVDLGENLDGAKIGLVVPKYMDIDSIEDLQPKE